MPIQRDQQPHFQQAGTQLNQYQGRRVGIAANPEPVAPSVDMGTINALQGILKTASNFAQKSMETRMEREYLEGARAAFAGESLDSLDSNVLTRPLQKAGYSDQTTRMGQAEFAASVAAKMPELRKLGPEDFKAEVSKLAGNLFKDTTGMSERGKKAALEQQLTIESALFKTYTAEHAKYNIETRAKEYNSRSKAVIGVLALAESSGDGPAYEQGTAAVLTLARNVLQDEGLPDDVKHKHVSSLVKTLAAADLTVPAQALMDSGILDSIPLEDTTALYTAVRESSNRTSVKRNLEFSQRFGAWKAAVEAGQPSTYEELLGFVGEGVRNKTMSESSVTQLYQWYGKNAAKSNRGADIARMFETGDRTGLTRLGVSESDAADAWVQNAVKASGMDAPTAYMGLLGMSSEFGYEAGFKAVGRFMNGMLGSFGKKDIELTEDAANTIVGLTTSLHALKQDGNPMATAEVLQGLAPENQDKLLAIIGGIEAGKTLTQAAQEYEETQSMLAGLTQTQKSAMFSTKRAEIDATLNDIQNSGFIVQAGRWIGKWFSPDIETAYNVAAKSGSPALAREQLRITSAIRTEMEDEIRRNPFMPVADAKEKALSRVSARTIRVGNAVDSTIILPQGSTAASVFGINGLSNDTAGQAIAEILPDTPKGYSPIMSVTPQGEVQVQWYNDEGATYAGEDLTIDPSVVREKVRDMDERAGLKAHAIFGEGVTVKDPTSNIGIKVNGVNAAGVAEEEMLLARQKLIEFERIRDTVYGDGKGYSVGVGIHFNSPFWPEGLPKTAAELARSNPRAMPTITPEQIRDSFLKHSNMTAKEVRTKMANRLGWDDLTGPRFQFLMQMGYQGGIGWDYLDKYKPLANAIRNNDREAALAALETTPVYIAAQDSRKRFYRQMLSESF